jgi:hypothetical protein
VGIALDSTNGSAVVSTGGGGHPKKRNSPVRRMTRLLVRLLLLASDDTRRRHHARARTGGRSHSSSVVDAGPLAALPGRRHGEPAMYYLGLIDFLQPFNTRKYVEYQLKALVYNRRSFSCIPPDAYADRFLDFLETHFT